MKEIRTILVTTDFSATSKKAFPLARELARKLGAKLIAAHVNDVHFPPLMLEYTDVGIERILERQKEVSREQLQRFVAAELGGEVPVELCLASGPAHEEIVKMAERLGVDLVVMATHGRGFISHAILGSTTERVIRRAPCPVLAVRDAAVRGLARAEEPAGP